MDARLASTVSGFGLPVAVATGVLATRSFGRASPALGLPRLRSLGRHAFPTGASQWGTVAAVASVLGCAHGALRSGQSRRQVRGSGRRDLGACEIQPAARAARRSASQRCKHVVLNGTAAPDSLSTLEPIETEEEEATSMTASASGQASALVPASSMGDDPEVKYETDLNLTKANFTEGEMHVVALACMDLLERKPDDVEVWRMMTTSYIRMRLYKEAQDACRRWLAFDPYSVSVKIAEAVCMAGNEQYGAARARFAALARELYETDPDIAREMDECMKRCEQLWLKETPGVAQMSTRAGEVVAGLKRPHIWLPNFADSIGPVKVLEAGPDEEGGGTVRCRKVVVTRDVHEGELLFVQRALVIGKVHDHEALDGMNRLEDALNVMVHVSPRAARLTELLADKGELPDDNDVVEAMRDIGFGQDLGPWSQDPREMDRHQTIVSEVVNECAIATGFQIYGIWPLASFMRHSCIPTANYCILGDTITVRANQRLAKDDEVTVPFFDVLMPVEERQEQFIRQRGGFWCNCPRCIQEQEFEEGIKEATERVQQVRKDNQSRIRALLVAMDTLMDGERKRFERETKVWAEKANRAQVEGLQGFADRYSEFKEELSQEELDSMLVEGMPEPIQEPRVKVPEDLHQTLLTALNDFENALAESTLNPAEKQLCKASHLGLYMDVMTLARFKEDIKLTRELVAKVTDVLEDVVPGSFEHQRAVVAAWEAAAVQLPDEEDRHIKQSEDILSAERDAVSWCMLLRYGADTSLLEQDGALIRTANSRLEDENWFWSMDWILGNSPEDPNLLPGTRPSTSLRVIT